MTTRTCRRRPPSSTEALAVALLLAALLAAPASATAADVGLKGGINSGSLRGELLIPGGHIDRRTDFVLGAYAVLGGGSRVALQPEVLYSRKGYTLDAAAGIADFGVPPFELRTRLSYLDLNLCARLALARPGRARPYLVGGGFAGIPLSGRFSNRVGGRVLEDDVDEDELRTDYGPLAGAGVRVTARGAEVDLEARYGWGLERFSDDVAPGDDFRSSVLTITVGLTF